MWIEKKCKYIWLIGVILATSHIYLQCAHRTKPMRVPFEQKLPVISQTILFIREVQVRSIQSFYSPIPMALEYSRKMYLQFSNRNGATLTHTGLYDFTQATHRSDLATILVHINIASV